MTDIFRVVGIGLAAATFAVLLRGKRPEFAIQLSLAAAAVMLFIALPYLETMLDAVRDISDYIGADARYITVILKIIGIAYAAQFGAELCRDAGESAVAAKIELAGKVIIMASAMPVMYRLLGVVEDIVRLGA